MIRRFKLNVEPAVFECLKDFSLKFVVGHSDDEYQRGDEILVLEYDETKPNPANKTAKKGYSGRELLFSITYVMRQAGQILSLERKK